MPNLSLCFLKTFRENNTDAVMFFVSANIFSLSCFILNKNKYICAYYYNYLLYENIFFTFLQLFPFVWRQQEFL